MKLFHSPTSPYVRKVMAVAIAGGLKDRITLLNTNPHASPPELLAQNPLSRVPCLLTEDGVALFDSPVICEYLDSIGDSTVFPPPGPARWRALRQQALGDGMMDAAVGRRLEQARPQEAARDAAMERQRGVVQRGLDALEAAPPADHLDIGAITIACTLGYLDFRFADEDWRGGRPKLAQWYAAMQQRPEIADTAPA